MRRAAKNTEGVTDFLCAALRGRALCSRKSLFCQSSTGTRHCSIHLPVFTPRYVYKCRAMSTYVAPKKNLGRFPCDLPNSSSPSLMDTARTIWGHFTAFQLTAFTFKFSMGESSGFSNRAPRLSIKRAHKGALPESGGRYRLFFSLMRLSCGEEQSRLSSDASLAHAGRPQRVPIRFRQPYEALHQFDAIILG